MPHDDRFEKAIAAFDAYNANDPNKVDHGGKAMAKEVMYAVRMTDRLNHFSSGSSEPLRLAVRCQHIGRWEIPRSKYPEGQKGYLLWRNTLKAHHAGIAEKILRDCGYGPEVIERVQFLLLKKQLKHDAEVQLLEDVICLVFMEHYLEDFAAKHEDQKVADILRKTLGKMSAGARTAALELPLKGKATSLIEKAVASFNP